MLENPDEKIQLSGVQSLKKLVMVDMQADTLLDLTLQQFIDSGVFQKIVEILKDNKKGCELQYQATWTLINSCCGSPSKVAEIIKVGAIDALLYIVEAVTDIPAIPDRFLYIASHCVWTIANIATDTTEHRDACLEQDAATKILKIS